MSTPDPALTVVLAISLLRTLYVFVPPEPLMIRVSTPTIVMMSVSALENDVEAIE